MNKIILSLGISLIAFTSLCQNLKLEIEGEATFDNSLYTINEAGDNFPSSMESEGSTYISVLFTDYWDKKNNPNRKWRISMQKSDVNWDSGLNLEVRRTGDGESQGKNSKSTIKDGQNYQNITNNSTYFFRGKDEVSYIPISLRISDYSIEMGAKEFETRIMFTVYDDW